MSLWIGVLATCLGCYLLKIAGLSIPARIVERPRVQWAADLLPVALLAALIAVSTVADGQEIALDARIAGLAFAAAALALRAPFLVVVLGAAATAALIRLL